MKNDFVRPTAQKIKQAVFNSIQFQIGGAIVLDLFAGCGQMGIEALSRGAHFAFFIDSNSESLEITKKNLINTKFLEKAKLFNQTAESFLISTKDRFDIAFLDPPYNKGLILQVMPTLIKKMNSGGKIICEMGKNEDLPTEFNSFILKKEYNYGNKKILTYIEKE